MNDEYEKHVTVIGNMLFQADAPAGYVAVLLRMIRDAIEAHTHTDELTMPPRWKDPTQHWPVVAGLLNTAVFLLYPLFEDELTADGADDGERVAHEN